CLFGWFCVCIVFSFCTVYFINMVPSCLIFQRYESAGCVWVVETMIKKYGINANTYLCSITKVFINNGFREISMKNSSFTRNIYLPLFVFNIVEWRMYLF